jgi:amidase
MGVTFDQGNAVGWADEHAVRGTGHEVGNVAGPRMDDSLTAYGRLIRTEFSLAWHQIRPLVGEATQLSSEQSMVQQPAVALADYIQLTATRLEIQREW